nr:MAG TPA: hypothetical protein [Caudoviricetes sp.]
MMAISRKARIAYNGPAIENGEMDVRDLAPALIAFADLVESVNHVLEGEQQIKVLLNQDSLQRGSFDITFILNMGILDQVSLFVSDAKENGLDDLMTVLGWGENAKWVGGVILGGVFSLLKYIGKRKIREVEEKDDQRAEIVLDDGERVITTKNAANVIINVNCRLNIEKVVQPLIQSGIDAFELRDPNKREDKNPIETIAKKEVEYFKALPAKPFEDREEEKTADLEMTVTIVTISFNDGKWKVSLGGENLIWVSIEDEEFNALVKSRKIAFASGDMLRIRYHMKQEVKSGKLHSEYIVTKVLEVQHASEQVALEFEPK